MLRRLLVVVVLAHMPLAAALPARAGGGGCGKPVSDARSSDVRIKSWCFTPTVTHVRVGGTVTWTNRDREKHNVAGANYLWGSRALRFDDSVTYRFTEKGTYPYVCQFHMGMVGAVVVGNGKSDEALGWRDEAVKKVRRNDSAGALPVADDNGPSSDAPQSQPATTPALGRTWPIEWFVVLSAALLACVSAVVLAARRGPTGESLHGPLRRHRGRFIFRRRGHSSI